MINFKSYHARKYADDGELDISQPYGSLGRAVLQDHFEVHTCQAIPWCLIKVFKGGGGSSGVGSVGSSGGGE